MADIAPELYNRVKSAFSRNMENDKKLQSLRKKIEDGRGTWKDAYDYGVRISDDLERAFALIKSDDLPNGKMYYNIAERVVRPLIEEMENNVREISRKIVEDQNKRLGIGLKAV